MPNPRALTLALWIAAAAVPIAGCGSDDADSGSQASDSTGADTTQQLLDGQPSQQPVDADSDAGSDTDQPMPINGANDAQDSTQNTPQQPGLADQIDTLRQQLADQNQHDQQQLHQQAQRIDQLEKTVQGLKTRLKRLPSPAAFKTAMSKSDKAKPSEPQNASSDTDSSDPDTPEAISPAAESPSANASSTDEGDSADESSKPAAASSSRSEHASSSRASCHESSRRDQFDVYYQGESSDALDSAKAAVTQAGLSDWFINRPSQRLYLGRYGTCALARHRSQAVHERTDLAVHIATVARSRAVHATHTASAGHDYGRAESTAQHSPQRPVASLTSAPFQIIGVEQRGAHQFLGVAPSTAAHLSQATWLSPGQSYGDWQLVTIQAHTATFNVADRRATVALPDRG